jgi:non-homologous end joining protein Ku
MWSGTIQLGLIPVPVTIGKAWADEREKGLQDLCATHKVPVDRSERCSSSGKCELSGGKIKGVATEDGYRALKPNEYEQIEEATKSATLTILDVQKIYDLPLDYATGTYYIRYDQKAKGFTPSAFAHLQALLTRRDVGLVVKWCKSARQQLAVITGDESGLLLLRTIPFANELREAGGTERVHMQEAIDENVIAQMSDLLDGIASDEFDHTAYSDEGVRLRSEAVERVLKGEQKGEKKKQKQEGGGVPDLMAALKASMAEQKLHQGEGQKA